MPRLANAGALTRAPCHPWVRRLDMTAPGWLMSCSKLMERPYNATRAMAIVFASMLKSATVAWAVLHVLIS